MAVPDPARATVIEALRTELGDALLGAEVATGELWVRVERSQWRRTIAYCKERLGFRYFCFLSGLDWKSDVDLAGEKVWDPNPPTSSEEPPGTGLAGGDTRFQVVVRLQQVPGSVGIMIKADLDDTGPSVDSIVEVFAGADWHERETWEMFGFDFEGHPGLRHIYLPTEFEGYPLRKDFPLLAREVKPWPGLVDVEPMPGEPEGEGDEAAEAS